MIYQDADVIELEKNVEQDCKQPQIDPSITAFEGILTGLIISLLLWIPIISFLIWLF